MNLAILLAAVLLLALYSYALGRGRALGQTTGHPSELHSRPGYYGTYTALWSVIPALLVIAIWLMAEGVIVEGLVVASLPQAQQDLPNAQLGLLLNDIRNVASGAFSAEQAEPFVRAAAERYNGLRLTSFIGMAAIAVLLAVIGLYWARRAIDPGLRARNAVERIVMVFLVAASTIAIFTTVGIVLSLLFEAWRFFSQVPFYEFLFGLQWSPQIALRADQVGSSGAFGAVPIFAGTLLISFIAMVVAVPVGLMSAIYMAEYATPKFRSFVKPLLEVLAGIPTVVYGFFAALTVAPQIRGFGESFGLDVASESALAAGLVMGIMIIPFVSSLSDDVISAVPRSLREGSYGMGATKSETIVRVILPAALPGIVGSILLAVSRAIGETMIVVMAAGLAANLTANPFQAVTTVTVQIVTLLVGDQEFDSPKTLAAFALGLVLFFITLCLNVIALHVVRKYREQYD
ncbi:MAG: phosphate ABC transporter permease subunit PstC [Alphaproteobacteria bacterium]|nr:phosphate ABC transporter permease subunit PstC [Alphaproteobacteria bacterium]